MLPNSSIAKGKELEKWIIQELKSSGLDHRAYRNPGSGSGMAKGDVDNALGLCIECKNQRNFSPSWYQQAEKESMGTQEPVVVWHPPQTPLEASMVFITWDYFKRLLLKSKEPPKINEPSRELKWKLQRLVDNAKNVIKELEG